MFVANMCIEWLMTWFKDHTEGLSDGITTFVVPLAKQITVPWTLIRSFGNTKPKCLLTMCQPGGDLLSLQGNLVMHPTLC